MKAYYPALKFIEPDPATYITERIGYYVATQVDLTFLDSKSAAVIIKLADNVNGGHVDLPVAVEYNELLGKVPVFGTKTDCDFACKTLNHAVKDKIAETIRLLNTI